MHSLKKLFLYLFLFPLSLFSTYCIPDCEVETDYTLEVRFASYDLSSRKLRKIYSNGWFDYQVEAAKRIHPYWEVWGGICWANKHGHVRSPYGSVDYEFRDNTKIFILPISLGLKCIYPILPYVDVYMGVGASYSFLKIKHFCKQEYSYWGLSESPFKKSLHTTDWGGVFKIGVQYAMSHYTFLDVFVDYYLQHFYFSHHDPRNVVGKHIDCSGFKYGAGIGVYF